jgi:ribosomal protein S18 acetylase RimI-like enzyme
MITIREFSERDTEEITRLMKNLCLIKGTYFDEERWKTSLVRKIKDDSHSEFIVAIDESNNNVLGMAQCSIKKDENGFMHGYISNLIVIEEMRRTGIGEQLMRRAIDFFRSNRIDSIRLALIPNLDKAAKVLFIKLGFQEILRIYELKI